MLIGCRELVGKANPLNFMYEAPPGLDKGKPKPRSFAKTTQSSTTIPFHPQTKRERQAGAKVRSKVRTSLGSSSSGSWKGSQMVEEEEEEREGRKGLRIPPRKSLSSLTGRRKGVLPPGRTTLRAWSYGTSPLG